MSGKANVAKPKPNPKSIGHVASKVFAEKVSLPTRPNLNNDFPKATRTSKIKPNSLLQSSQPKFPVIQSSKTITRKQQNPTLESKFSNVTNNKTVFRIYDDESQTPSLSTIDSINGDEKDSVSDYNSSEYKQFSNEEEKDDDDYINNNNNNTGKYKKNEMKFANHMESKQTPNSKLPILKTSNANQKIKVHSEENKRNVNHKPISNTKVSHTQHQSKPKQSQIPSKSEEIHPKHKTTNKSKHVEISNHHPPQNANKNSDKYKNYQIIKPLGKGAFGEVFLVERDFDAKEFAMKVESPEATTRMLYHEAKILKLLSESQNNRNFVPKIEATFYGNIGTALVMEKLGTNLGSLFSKYSKKFTHKTILLLGIQMLDAIRFIHNNSVLHRDLKPENFLIGTGQKSNRIYLVDFGLSKIYTYYNETTKKNEHVKSASNCGFKGTARFCSTNAHACKEQSRRDDMISIGYILIYFAKNGNLPWSGVSVKRKNANSREIRREKSNLIWQIKLQLSDSDLCKGLDKCFCEYLTAVKKLKFYETPNYERLKEYFVNSFDDHGFEPDGKMDWNLPIRKREDEKSSSSSSFSYQSQ